MEAAVLLAEQVLRRDLHVGERELTGVGGVPAHLLQLARDLVALHVALQHQEREPVVASLLGGLHRAHEEIGANAVGDERLGAVHHVAARDPAGEGADAGDVGTSPGLGDPQRPDLLPANRRAE
jgi:hypothetical protein